MGAVSSRDNKYDAQRIIDLSKNISTIEKLEILDDDFANEIIEIIDECMVFISETYHAERSRIVDEMRRLSPKSYHGLLFSDYPTKNGPKVNEMAFKRVISNEAKYQFNNQIHQMIKSSFESQTADWNSKSRKLARLFIKKLIEELFNEAIDDLLLE